MDAYTLEWLSMLLRWAHVVTAIAWIGASFHFVALDNSLTPPADPSDRERGVGGELWAVHGGGFYHQQKYPVSPPQLPERLHWSMWESYSTWLTGFALFTVLYLFNAGTYLVDRRVFDWSPGQATAGALGLLVAFWLAYDLICRVFGARRHGDRIVGACVFALVVAAAWLSCQLFAGRAAYLLVGAMLATSMSANVLVWIIPGQRKVVASLRAGHAVDPVHGRRGKQRSVHNTFFTLPVLFAMVSNHFGMFHAHRLAWVWLVLMMLAGALIRLSFVLRHGARAAGRPGPWRYAVAGALLVVGVFVGRLERKPVDGAAPAPASVPQAAPDASAAASSRLIVTGPASAGAGWSRVAEVVQQRCVMCHNAGMANKGVALHTSALMARHAPAVYQQVVVNKAMPLNNATGMTDEERALIALWHDAGGPAP